MIPAGKGRRIALCALVCGVATPAATVLTAWGAPAVHLHVVATGLDNPRKLVVAPEGSVYVVEAGRGANGKTTRCLRSCVGRTGSVVRVAGGKVTPVVTGLGSFALPGGQDAEGPVAVALQGSRYLVLMQDMQIDSHGVNKIGLLHAGELFTAGAGTVKGRTIAKLASFEAAHNPDHGAGPGPRFGQPPIDSDPYAFVSYRGGFAVVDAAGNDLLWVKPDGAISVLAVFPVDNVRLTAAERRFFRPAAPAVLPVQAVPSCVAVGPDGALYVGAFTGWPYRVGSARVWRVVPGKAPTVYASGFTNISDLAFAGHDLLVLELATRGLLDPTSPGALIRVSPNGARAVIASAGLISPTGLAVGAKSIFISNDGASPSTGPGPHGELVSLPLPRG